MIGAYSQFEVELIDWVTRNLPAIVANPLLLLLGGFTLVAPVLAASTYLFRYAAKAVAAERMPPPGFAVVRDTPIITGRTAVVRGRVVQAACAAILLAAAGIPIYLALVLTGLAGI